MKFIQDQDGTYHNIDRMLSIKIFQQDPTDWRILAHTDTGIPIALRYGIFTQTTAQKILEDIMTLVES